jgi:hypothetical protein
MTNQHPITPPPELIEELQDLGNLDAIRLAYQAGADLELEACCLWLHKEINTGWCLAPQLHAARRPKPPTLNSIALQMLGTIEQSEHFIPEITDTIRKALEALPND